MDLLLLIFFWVVIVPTIVILFQVGLDKVNKLLGTKPKVDSDHIKNWINHRHMNFKNSHDLVKAVASNFHREDWLNDKNFIVWALAESRLFLRANEGVECCPKCDRLSRIINVINYDSENIFLDCLCADCYPNKWKITIKRKSQDEEKIEQMKWEEKWIKQQESERIRRESEKQKMNLEWEKIKKEKYVANTAQKTTINIYYSILGISNENASPELIREAYLKAVLNNHPDKIKDDPYVEERFKSIQKAYETLMKEHGE